MTESEPLPVVSASGEVIRREPAQVALDGLRNFQDLILSRLGGLGLPTEDVLVALNQRHALLQTTEHALAGLNDEQRARSAYIAKMIMAGSVGLFDAALNYLWDETVIELRKRVIGYDLSYFYAVAEKSENRRKELKTADDLVKLDDSKLLSGAREIGLISDVGYHQVDHIRFMRNYASAAHPNQVSLTGLQLADWLETCIREVITLPHNNVVAEIKKLVVNVQAARLDSTYLAQTAVFFKELPTEKADTLAIGLFGVYTAISAEPHTRDNIRDLWPKLWPYISDDTRFWAGTRLGRFLADADHAQAALARQLIDLAQGELPPRSGQGLRDGRGDRGAHGCAPRREQLLQRTASSPATGRTRGTARVCPGQPCPPVRQDRGHGVPHQRQRPSVRGRADLPRSDRPIRPAAGFTRPPIVRQC